MDEHLLWELYKNSTLEEMAKVLHISKREVVSYVKKYNFVERFKEGVPSNCKQCHKPIVVKDKRTKFCPECVAEMAKVRAAEATARHRARVEAGEVGSKPAGSNIRPYTETSDMIIQDWMDKEMSTKEIARLLDRDHDDLVKHIEWMHENKVFDRVRKIQEEYRKHMPSRMPTFRIPDGVEL